MCYNKLDWGGKILPKKFGSEFSSVNLRVGIQRFCFAVKDSKGAF
jgi:hypothetical protein